MNRIDFKHLVKKLNPFSTSALEGAVGLCMTSTHYEITLAHFLLKLLEQPDGQIGLLLAAQNLDIAAFRLNIIRELSDLSKGNLQRPSFASNLFEVLEMAWLLASINLKLSKISSGALLLALIQYARTHHYHYLECLAELNLDTLEKEFFTFTQTSCEHAVESDTKVDDLPESSLSKFCEDLTQKAKAHQLDPVYGREDEIRQMIDVLSRRRKNNPILVGEAGVGKTALAEGLALKIILGEVPEQLKKVRLLTLDLGALEAGAGVRGEYEQRIKNILQEIKSSSTSIILFIDEAHLMMGANAQDAANLLKPALARGEIRVIAATTWSEYKKYIEKDPALTRRFQLLKVAAPDITQTLMILRGLRQQYEEAHQVVIRDDALVKISELSTRYIPDRQQPDKAIDLLDTAAARIKVNLVARPQALELLSLQMASLKREEAGLLRDLTHGVSVERVRLTEIEVELQDIDQRYKKLEQQWQKELKIIQEILAVRTAIARSTPHTKALTKLHLKHTRLNKKLTEQRQDAPLVFYEVDPDSVAQVVADWTRIPLGKVLRDEASDLLVLDTQLKKRIKGQDEALYLVSEQLKLAKSGLKDPRQPLGVFLLVGPSGVGKTETALTVADTLFGGDQSLITINMSEFQETHTISRLIGSPPGYIGYGEGGRLTEAVRKRPYSVILLDEVEKANLDVLNLFYQVFDKGSLTDGEGREVDFSQTVIFLTSNLATETIAELCARQADIALSAIIQEIRPALSHSFKPALLARLSIIPYKNLRTAELGEIASLKLAELAGRLLEQYKINLHYTEALLEHLAGNCFENEMGARNIDALIKMELMPALSKVILEAMLDKTMPEFIKITLNKDHKIVIKNHY